MLDEITSKVMHKDKDGQEKVERSKTLNKIKPDRN